MNIADLYKKLYELNLTEHTVDLYTAIVSKPPFTVGDAVAVEGNEVITSTLSDEAAALLSGYQFNIQPKTGAITITLNNEDYTFYYERFEAYPRLIIFGAGHISVSLCKLARYFDFKISVIDDRQDLLDVIITPDVEKICTGFASFKDRITVTEKDFIVIVTRGHVYDKEVLEQVIESNARYIGMIGSKKRIIAVKQLMANKFNNDFSKLYSPIGLPINNNKVEEIALSILSEIVTVKNNAVPKLKKYTDEK